MVKRRRSRVTGALLRSGLLYGSGTAGRFGGTSMDGEREAQGEVADEEVHGGTGHQTEL